MTFDNKQGYMGLKYVLIHRIKLIKNIVDFQDFHTKLGYTYNISLLSVSGYSDFNQTVVEPGTSKIELKGSISSLAELHLILDFS